MEVQLSSAMPELTEAALPAALFVSQDLWRVQGGEFASRSASSLLCALDFFNDLQAKNAQKCVVLLGF